MKKQILILLVVTALVLTSVLPVALTTGQTSNLQCVPNSSPVIEEEAIEIEIIGTQDSLQAKFFYPKPSTTTNYANESMPGIVMTHGIGGSLKDIESDAVGLAQRCGVILAFNYRGQGVLTKDIDSLSYFQGDPERNDLTFVFDRLVIGPSEADLVNANYLGMYGDSQASLATWFAIADYDLRGRIQAAIPHNSGPMMSQIAAPNDCLNANLSALFDPRNVRDPGPTSTVGAGTAESTPDKDGILWHQDTYDDLSDAYLSSPPDVPFWQTAIATRDPGDELPPVTATGEVVATIDHPYVYAQAGQEDVWQWSDETAAGWQIVTPPAPGSGYPRTHLELGRGGHVADNSYYAQSSQEKIDDRRAWGNWFQTFLGPFYDPTLTASPPPSLPGPGDPTWTPSPTPLNTPASVNYLVDSFNPNPELPLVPIPTFEKLAASAWPPTNTVAAQLYLHSGGVVNLTPPVTTEAYDDIGQDYTPGSAAYNMGTAVAESPAFGTWDEHIDLSGLTVVYVSPPLAQDVTLIGPPQVELYAEPVSPLYDYPIQVHVRVREQLAETASVFITRANVCAWTATDASESGWFEGTPYFGETRVHLFKAGNRIELELTSIDEQTYNPGHISLFMTPHLDEMRVRVFHRQTQATNVSLPLLLSDPDGELFDESGGSLGAPRAPENAAEPTATPEPPGPLTIDAILWPEFTNPGGWHNYAPKVFIDCHGGEDEVTCPEDAVLDSDGINQRFVFTATDSVGTVVTTTVPNVTIDRTPPLLTTTLPEAQTFCSGSTTQLDFSVSDALSGLVESTATFNGQLAEDGDVFSLLAGANALSVHSRDVAGNRIVAEEILQANYDETLNFPPNGQNVNPLLPLSFAFQVNDACAVGGKYGNALGTLWLTGPDGEEIPAEWFGIATGNTFSYNALTGWYAFDADLTGLATGTWTARAHLDDGTDHTVTFVISGGLGGESAEDTATTAVRPACQDGWLRPLLGVGRCR